MQNKKHKKTKILAVGDIHGDTTLVKKLAKKAKNEHVDVVLLTGDQTWAEESIKGIIGPFAKNKIPILLIPGNHETIETNKIMSELYSPYAKNLHGYYFQDDGVAFFGAGTAHLGPGDIISDKEIYSLLKRSHEKIKALKKKIMVTHIHPEETKSEFSGIPGSTAVRRAIEKFQPDFAICSHIHEASGLEDKIGKTKVINVARKEKYLKFNLGAAEF